MKKFDPEKSQASKQLDEFIDTHLGNVNLAGYDKGKVVQSLVEEKEFSKYKGASPGKEGRQVAQKSKIKKFPTIGHALGVSNYGQIFTTPQSDRIYVVTRGTWGKKSANKVVKGFPAETDHSKILGYSKRTKAKHASRPGVERELEQEKAKKQKED